MMKNLANYKLAVRLKASANKPHINVAIAHHHIASMERLRHHDYSAAQSNIESALNIINQVDPNNIWAAICKSEKGKIMQNQDKKKEAKQLQEDALRVAKRKLGENNFTVSNIYLEFGLLFNVMNHYKDAERMYKKAIKAAENSLGPNNTQVAKALYWLALMYYNLERYQEAEESYLRSIDICKCVSCRLSQH